MCLRAHPIILIPLDWQRPSPQQLWRAIETYLHVAYANASPSSVLQRIAPIRTAPPEHLFDSPLFEHPNPDRYCLRLGNRLYPHMKLNIDRAPDGGHLFSADTHDRHCLPPPQSREYSAVCGLMEQNKQIAANIHSAWENAGLRTFRTYLRDDLARRARS